MNYEKQTHSFAIQFILLSQPLTGQELSKSGGNIKGGFRVGLVASQISAMT